MVRRRLEPVAVSLTQTAALHRWYRIHGRHDLPWRSTRDPWLILVSEVMLQQTSVRRVLPAWAGFVERWPTAAACAAAPLDDVLRLWQGLGYPRRARALWQCAQEVTHHGWPRTEGALLRLSGVGPYTARALLWFAFDTGDEPPRDVNLARVASRAWLGVEPDDARPRQIDTALQQRRQGQTSRRDFAYALFDLGALVCCARAVQCGACPLRGSCRSRDRLASGVPRRPRRQAPYSGSIRELRGAVLREMVGPSPPTSLAALEARVSAVPACQGRGNLEGAVDGLQHDGLVVFPWRSAIGS